MSKVKIAVIGSCVSRDGFNSKFIKNYKEFYHCVLTQNHMSMISLMGDPIPFTPIELEGDIDHFNKQILLTELTKGVWDSLRIQNPDYLILDFYADVYFGVVKIGNSFVTDKTHIFKRTPFFSQFEVANAVKIDKNYNEFMRLWKQSVDQFMDNMRKDFPKIKIIVNKVHFTDYYMTKDGKEKKKISESGKYKSVDVNQINHWLDDFYKYFEDHYEDVAFINYDTEYLSDENHIWEYFYVHYTHNFYEDFTTKLLSIILHDLYTKRDIEYTSSIETTGNLIKNPSFNLGKSFWSYWQDNFVIQNPEEDEPTSNIVKISNKGLTKKAHRQIWSNPIEINTDGEQEYTISFDIKVEDVMEVDADRFVFSLRTYNQIDKVLQKDAVWRENILLDDITGITNRQWIRYTRVVKPSKGKFLKVGPYLMQNGQVYWRNITIELGDTTIQNDDWKNNLLLRMKNLILPKNE
ncbi:DUF6270 domain-containing protein [Bacillus andreraoultii]|uniref:DUF6270 domain-containing protein n=1 Tax=Bacillus andreraoultii TaxID=1499685 RepID=UPI00067ECB89|nr:DUF6270 domain-containing protein [Bacillus andreraoultii]